MQPQAELIFKHMKNNRICYIVVTRVKLLLILAVSFVNNYWQNGSLWRAAVSKFIKFTCQAGKFVL